MKNNGKCISLNNCNKNFCNGNGNCVKDNFNGNNNIKCQCKANFIGNKCDKCFNNKRIYPNCDDLNEVVIPDTVTEIGAFAFDGFYFFFVAVSSEYLPVFLHYNYLLHILLLNLKN